MSSPLSKRRRIESVFLNDINNDDFSLSLSDDDCSVRQIPSRIQNESLVVNAPCVEDVAHIHITEAGSTKNFISYSSYK